MMSLPGSAPRCRTGWRASAVREQRSALLASNREASPRCQIAQLCLLGHCRSPERPRLPEDVLVLSLGSGGMKRLQKQLPSARPGPFENTLTYDTETDFSTYKQKIPSITRHITYHVFESADRPA